MGGVKGPLCSYCGSEELGFGHRCRGKMRVQFRDFCYGTGRDAPGLTDAELDRLVGTKSEKSLFHAFKELRGKKG